MQAFGVDDVPEDCIIYRSDMSFAFTDIHPVLNGHVLVSPLRNVQYLSDLSEDEKRDLFSTAEYVGKVMQEHLNVQSFSVMIQDGPEAGQKVSHVHAHVFPRNFPTHFAKAKPLVGEERKRISRLYRSFFERAQ